MLTVLGIAYVMVYGIAVMLGGAALSAEAAGYTGPGHELAAWAPRLWYATGGASAFVIVFGYVQAMQGKGG